MIAEKAVKSFVYTCPFCKHHFGLITDSWGLGLDFLKIDYRISFHNHKVACSVLNESARREFAQPLDTLNILKRNGL